MGTQARNYSQLTLKKLFALSGNECAFPGCTKQLVNQTNAKDSNICHIEAANDDGERYREDMTDKERADYENLILLCVQHHDETNDVEKYTVEALKQMKDNHEASITARNLGKSTSMLQIAINKIAELGLSSLKDRQSTTAFNITNKLNHNAVKSKRRVINELSAYYHKLNMLYDELDKAGSLKKESLLDNIHHIYLEASGKYVGCSDDYMPIIQQNSDAIYEDVFDELLSLIDCESVKLEDFAPALRVVMVDAFMRCKILEEPPVPNESNNDY
ncbi:hypothetical protein RV040_003198 [Vibrio alginolyticus]|jgi:hypothetical protein|uniref:ABC-three component system protein n=1 Tax=Vibrio TaxID=662 RepID=UPI001483093D|nr:MULTISPECIES: ABC-three component system protein [unclassified Vibrio]ELK8499686.1 hypothetical protein [Vibrio alginolyticus]MDW1548870.1 ABC-three component system protein [Vibrio sp. YT-18]NNN54994.1 hypothetical protein [Vibrio sp. 1-2 (7-a)]